MLSEYYKLNYIELYFGVMKILFLLFINYLNNILLFLQNKFYDFGSMINSNYIELYFAVMKILFLLFINYLKNNLLFC